MANLIVRHRRRWYEISLPHALFVNNTFVGVMKGDVASLALPPGNCLLRVQLGGPVRVWKWNLDLSLSSCRVVTLANGSPVTVAFHDRERFWNILFDVDLFLWVLGLFVKMPLIYKILSDLFFLVWLVRLVLVRKRFYSMTLE
ncbi:MAG: hypothetical protein K5867_00595 [Bacteroidales bacterium]|nr:hypothetical protein [Bacteroidales bacterium]